MKKILICIILILLCACNKLDKSNDFISISTQYRRVISPILFDNSLFMAVSMKNRTSNDTNILIQYNMQTKKYIKIFESEFEYANIQGIQVNKNWLVWEDMSVDGTRDNIWVMNRKNNNKKKINISKTENPSFTVPILIDNYILWINEEKIINNKLKGSIKQYDCLQDETKVICSINEIGMHNFRLENYGESILWSDKIKDDSYYFVYNVHTKKRLEIKINMDYSLHPILIDRCIISNEFADEDDIDENSALQPYIYNIDTKKSHKLDVKLNGYYSYNDNLVTNDGKDVFIYSIEDNLNIKKEETIVNENYEDYYVSQNESLIFLRKNSNNYIDLLIYTKDNLF